VKKMMKGDMMKGSLHVAYSAQAAVISGRNYRNESSVGSTCNDGLVTRPVGCVDLQFKGEYDGKKSRWTTSRLYSCQAVDVHVTA